MKSVLTFLLAVIVLSAKAQQNRFGIEAGIGAGVILQEKMLGGPSLSTGAGLTVGLQYDRALVGKLHLLTGLNWYHNTVTMRSESYPDLERTVKHTALNLLYIPVQVKYNFSRYFYINGGLSGDIDISKKKEINNLSGIGAGLGIGTALNISPSLAVELNPYLNCHGIILFQKNNHPQRLLDTGITLRLVLR